MNTAGGENKIRYGFLNSWAAGIAAAKDGWHMSSARCQQCGALMYRRDEDSLCTTEILSRYGKRK